MPWKRRPFDGRNSARALNIADLREIARRRVPGFAFEYVEGGAEDEATLRRNREAFSRLRFVPQTLVDTSGRSFGTSVFGRASSAPDRKSTRLNSSHMSISYAVFCLKKKRA